MEIEHAREIWVSLRKTSPSREGDVKDRGSRPALISTSGGHVPSTHQRGDSETS